MKRCAEWAPTAAVSSMKRRADGTSTGKDVRVVATTLPLNLITSQATEGNKQARTSLFLKEASAREGGSKATRTLEACGVLEALAPPPGYWVSQKQKQKQSAAEDTTTDTFDIFHTRFMRRKLEYLLNQCAEHKDGCSRCTPLCNVHVVEVSRIENHLLWGRFAAAQATQQKQHGQAWAEKSRPIKCDVGGEDERFLFHGTSPLAASKIAAEGFMIRRASSKTLLPTPSRYGQGIYFTDQSCKAHQYSDKKFVLQEDGSKLYCMLYCRVSTRNSLDFKVTEDVRQNRYLQGMVKPTPSDEVFRQRLPEVQQTFDSLVVVPCQRLQIHREVVVFDTDQVYPEYIVWYKVPASIDTQTPQMVGLGGVGGSTAAAPDGTFGKFCPVLAAPQTRLLEDTPEPEEHGKSPASVEKCRTDALEYYAITCARRQRERERKEMASEEREREDRAGERVRERTRERATRTQERKKKYVEPEHPSSISARVPTVRPARKRPDFFHLNTQLMHQKARNPKTSEKIECVAGVGAARYATGAECSVGARRYIFIYVYICVCIYMQIYRNLRHL